ncbi:MAG: leucine-rich repeat domain-containing protein, partial [Tannerellaceae bacterium]
MRKPILYLCIALFCCAACSNDPEVNIEPQAPRLNVNDSLAIVDIWEKADGKNWYNKWDLKDFQTWGG